MARSPSPKKPEPDIIITDREVIIRNIIWNCAGGAIMKWFDTNTPDCQYTMQFVKNSNGRVIPNQPVKLVFDKPAALVLAKLKGIDF